MYTLTQKANQTSMAITGFSSHPNIAKPTRHKQRTHTFNSKGEGPETVKSAINRQRKRLTGKALSHAAGCFKRNELKNKKGYSTASPFYQTSNALHRITALVKQKQDQYLEIQDEIINSVFLFSKNATLFSYSLCFYSICHTSHVFQFFPFQFLLTLKMDITLFIFPEASRFISNLLLASAMIKNS